MSQIEQSAGAGLVLVLADDAGLGGAADLHRLLARCLVAVYQARAVVLEPAEEAGIVDEAVLHDLGIAG